MSNGDSLSLPKGWAWTRLGEMCLVNPRSFISTPQDDEPISFVPMAAVEVITGTMDASQIRRYGEVKKGYTPFSEGDVLFAKITPCMENGKVAVAKNLKNRNGCGSTEFHVLRPLGGIPSNLLVYYLLQDEFRREARRHMTGTAGQLRVPAWFLDKARFPLPPLPEQRHIVAKIEELFTRLDAGVEALKKVKVQLKAYRQAVLKYAFEGKLTAEWREAHKGDMEPASVLLERIKEERRKNARGKFKETLPLDTSDLPELPQGWGWTRLGDISLLVTKGSTPTSYGFNYTSSGINFIKVENLMDGRVDRSSLSEFITKDTHEFLKRSQLSPNDVLFSIAGTIGRVAIVQHEDLPANTNQAIALIRCPWQFIGPKYLKNVLGSTIVRSSIEKRPRGIGMNNVSLGDVNNIVFPLAPLPEQHRIVEEIERRFSVADQVEKIVERSLKQAERLRQSILKRAFEGRLVLQDPTDEPAERLLERIKAEQRVGATGRSPLPGVVKQKPVNHQRRAG